MKKHTAPILAAILLLLPMLYVGSYLALVVPDAGPMERINFNDDGGMIFAMEVNNYRWGRDHSAWFFYPLEQIDRKLRPVAWEGY